MPTSFPHTYLWLAIGAQSLGLAILLAYVLLMRFRANSRLGALRKELQEFASHAALHRSHTRRLGEIDKHLHNLGESTGGMWRTALGTLLQIRQMSDAHIANAIAYCDEVGSEADEGRARLCAEQKRRRYDARMSEKQAQAEIKRFHEVTRDPAVKVEFKGLDTLEQIGACMGLTGARPAKTSGYPAGEPTATRGNRLQREVADLVDLYDRLGKPGDVTCPLDGRIFENLRTALAESLDRGCMPAPDWKEIDRVLKGLIDRHGLSSIKVDLHKLWHLLARGRKS
jgi:hypothetical protein